MINTDYCTGCTGKFNYFFLLIKFDKFSFFFFFLITDYRNLRDNGICTFYFASFVQIDFQLFLTYNLLHIIYLFIVSMQILYS